MKKVKSFEEACEVLGLDPTALPDVSKLPVKHQQASICNYKLMIVAEALNEGWQPNWNDMNEAKYQPVFEVKASKNKLGGSGLVCYTARRWYDDTDVSSRLCFKSRELAEYAGKTKAIKELYEGYFLIK